MGKTSSQDIAQWVECNIANEDWLSLYDVCMDCVRRVLPEVPTLTASDWIEEELIYVAEILRNRSAQIKDDGASPTFKIDGNEPPYLKRENAELAAILEMLRGMDPFEFEGICSAILSALGGRAATTQKSYDGGVDFYAFEMDRFAAGMPVPKVAGLTVIGQAKRYKDNNFVSESEIRKFIGGAVDIANSFKIDKKLTALGPVLFAFWTTSSFHENARTYCKRTGVWYMEGLSVAEYVKKLGLQHLIDGRI